MKRVVLTMVALAVLGCGDASMVNTRSQEPAAGEAAPAGAAPGAPAGMLGMPGRMGQATPGQEKAAKLAVAGRKIIHNARVDLVTEDLAALERRLDSLVATSGGYVADSEVSGKAGSRRDATWKVRVPVDGYASFLDQAKSLGELVSVKEDAQDVSEEYFDVEARLANKKVEEQRLVKLLTDATGKLEEILQVERELSRVREEVERYEGRLRALGNLTTLATVTVSAREVHGYVPEQAPTFSTRVARRFEGSVDALRRSGENLVLFLVGIGPWLPVILAVALPLFVLRRWVWRLMTTPLTPTK